MKNSVLTGIIVVLLVTCLAIPIFATDQEGLGAGMKAAYYKAASASLSISGGTATATGKVVGNTSVTKITIKLYLQQQVSGSWSNVGSWSGTKNGKDYTLKKTKVVSKGKYRTKAICTVYAGTKSEKVTKYSSTVTY